MATGVIVLGGSGMLGSMVARYLSSYDDLDVSATVRTTDLATAWRERVPRVVWRIFDAEGKDPVQAFDVIDGNEWIVNCIGIVKPMIREDEPAEVERAIRINAALPHMLAKRAAVTGTRVLQIATDCVYSGRTGSYTERAPHDALDVYGKTKSLGEVNSASVRHLRCSIVGPEWGKRRSLLEWFRGQSRGGRVTGYTNHRWNGVTTRHFAKLCLGLIRYDVAVPHVLHVVPTDVVTKCELLELFAEQYGRKDITIEPSEAAISVDRTLSTMHEEANRTLWRAAGHAGPPTIAEMVAEMASADARNVAEI
jgi:dTDP-4-dehydrorhamnose reductase